MGSAGKARGSRESLFRPACVADVFSEAPATAEFHRTDVHESHLGQRGWRGVSLDDETVDATLTQIVGQGQADGATADDQHGSVFENGHDGDDTFRSPGASRLL